MAQWCFGSYSYAEPLLNPQCLDYQAILQHDSYEPVVLTWLAESPSAVQQQ
ncbi:hypothetical protein ACNQOT_17120 [Acinetobacter baumannii]|nr:hypothetical protein [Acinetobacter baumannii]